jgi:hypothetical protein
MKTFCNFMIFRMFQRFFEILILFLKKFQVLDIVLKALLLREKETPRKKVPLRTSETIAIFDKILLNLMNFYTE